MNLFPKIERSILKIIMSLPSERLLSTFGIRAVFVGKQKLHPEIQVYLLIRRLMKKPAMGDLPPAESRKTYVKDSLVHGIKIDGIKSEDFVVKPGLQARLYFRDASVAPLLYYLHGGGFVIGDVEMFDHVCRYMAMVTGFKVLAVDYRKAPEYPFPFAIHDSVDGYRWALKHQTDLKIDSEKIAIAGDSAGANLAAIVTQILNEESTLLPKIQLLLYPTCDWSKDYESADLFGSGFFLTKKDFQYFAHHYHQGSECDLFHPWVSPLHGKLHGLPKTFIVTAGFDPLRDQGEAYAEKLKKEGVDVTLIREDGMIHGFINLIGFSKYSREVFTKTLSLLKL
jgi:acetyl esterase